MKAAKAWGSIHRPAVKRVNPLFSRLLLLFLILVVLAWSIYPLKHRYQQKRQIGSLEKELKNVRQENKVLQSEVDRLKSPDYIEILARKNFGLIKPDEEAYVVALSPEEEVEITEPNQKTKPVKKTLLQSIKKFFESRF